MTEGFCIPCGADVPVTEQLRCVKDGELAIPPTWASATAEFPWPARPEGYVYVPPAYLREHQKTLNDSISAHRKPAPKKRAVSSALDKKLRPPKAPERTGQRLVSFICEACRTQVTTEKRGGPAKRFCSSQCRNKGRKQRPGGRHDIRRFSMSAEGRACLACGRSDVPHRSHGRCATCAQQYRRQRKKGVAA